MYDNICELYRVDSCVGAGVRDVDLSSRFICTLTPEVLL